MSLVLPLRPGGSLSLECFQIGTIGTRITCFSHFWQSGRRRNRYSRVFILLFPRRYPVRSTFLAGVLGWWFYKRELSDLGWSQECVPGSQEAPHWTGLSHTSAIDSRFLPPPTFDAPVAAELHHSNQTWSVCGMRTETCAADNVCCSAASPEAGGEVQESQKAAPRKQSR